VLVLGPNAATSTGRDTAQVEPERGAVLFVLVVLVLARFLGSGAQNVTGKVENP
jgi:hypothetical protein